MRNWLQVHPFVVLLLPLIAGILLCNYTGFPFDLQHKKQADFPDFTGTYEAIIQDYPVEKSKTFRYTARIGNRDIYLYLHKDSTRIFPEAGDVLSVRTRIKMPDSIGTFDYGTYLRRQGIMGQAYAASAHWQIIGHTNGGILVFARRLQHRLIERYRELGISGAELGTLSALTLGYREDLDPDIKRSFRRSGAAHVLAVSGLHTGIIYTVVLALLTGFGYWKPLYEERKRRMVNGLVVITAMAFYALLTGLSPSVCRSVLMLSIIEYAYMSYRRPTAVNTIAAAAFFILAFRPNDLFSVSFQLSFAAVISIMIFVPLFKQIIPLPNRRWTKPLRDTLNIVSVSLAVQIGTLPLSLYYFHQTCNYFILTNVVVIPLALVITLLAFATLTIGWIPFVGTVLAFPLKWLVWALNYYTAFIESLPGAFASF